MSENTVSEKSLLDEAKGVWPKAYAPYSGFRVGAAIRSPSGRVHLGVNVENAAYPEGTCAEAGAIAARALAPRTTRPTSCNSLGWSRWNLDSS